MFGKVLYMNSLATYLNNIHYYLDKHGVNLTLPGFVNSGIALSIVDII